MFVFRIRRTLPLECRNDLQLADGLLSDGPQLRLLVECSQRHELELGAIARIPSRVRVTFSTHVKQLLSMGFSAAPLGASRIAKLGFARAKGHFKTT